MEEYGISESLRGFVDMFAERDLSNAVAATLNCGEANKFAELIDDAGEGWTAVCLIVDHFDHDSDCQMQSHAIIPEWLWPSIENGDFHRNQTVLLEVFSETNQK